MGLFGVLLIIFVSIFAFLIIAFVIRYAIDSSQTSRRLDVLIQEVRYLRAEVKRQNQGDSDDNNHIFDKKV
ncbi:putative membrane protein [Paenibacillus tundrae]|uniref:Membrane protein n=1 Tax=Paenibacillus tundrae TaxID=528187 RepID=A0ABT9WCP4_9BACL|nr:putative membrane protein [Paenibacillus tundrae]